jgi:hypothetical protein
MTVKNSALELGSDYESIFRLQSILTEVAKQVSTESVIKRELSDIQEKFGPDRDDEGFYVMLVAESMTRASRLSQIEHRAKRWLELLGIWSKIQEKE